MGEDGEGETKKNRASSLITADPAGVNAEMEETILATPEGEDLWSVTFVSICRDETDASSQRTFSALWWPHLR